MNKYVLNVFKDKKAMKVLNWTSILLTVLMFIPVFIIDLLYTGNMGNAIIGREYLGVAGSVLLIIALMFGIITVHEGIHGLFFKIFSPAGRLKFGYKAGMFYAAAPGEIFTRKRFMVIIIMPFIVITTVLLILMFTVPHGSYKYFIALHTGACAGDFYYLYLLLKYKNMQFVEDTPVGMTMYETHPGVRA